MAHFKIFVKSILYLRYLFIIKFLQRFIKFIRFVLDSFEHLIT